MMNPKSSIRRSVPLLCLVALGCGSSHDRGSAGDGGSVADASARRDGGGRADSGPGPGVDAGARSCGGFAEEACGDDEWCDYPDGSYCGGDDSTGICRPRPTGCDLLYDPVCGCDGRTYGNECAAQSAGVDVASRGECEGPGGPICTNDAPCASGICVGATCGEVWRCIDSTRPCTDDSAPHCGCDGETFYDSSTCQRQPFMFAGACEDGVGCDGRSVLCDALPPACPSGQVPSVEGACWGPCVDVGYCRCETRDECPGDYVCHGATDRCGPPVGG